MFVAMFSSHISLHSSIVQIEFGLLKLVEWDSVVKMAIHNSSAMTRRDDRHP
jgi:hypothetical protein